MPDLTRKQRIRAWIKTDAERIHRDAVAAKVASSLLDEDRVVDLGVTTADTRMYGHSADAMRYITQAYFVHAKEVLSDIAKLHAERHAA